LHCGKPRGADAEGWERVNDLQFRCDNARSDGPRYVEVSCDYETSERAGASGMFQVVEPTQNGEDVTDLVDQGIHFIALNHLRRHLRRSHRRWGDEITEA
jgi:hypothetical protein